MTAFDTTSQQRIQIWNKNLTKPILLTLDTSDHPESVNFLEIAGQLEATAPSLTLKTQKGDHLLPGFVIAPNIRFCAFPVQKELSPFLDALTQVNSNIPALPDSLAQQIAQVAIPAHLKLYIALQCPHCPVMVSTMVSLCLGNPNLVLEIIDGSLFSDEAQKDRVMAAPCLILDDDFRWTGNVSTDEILTMIIQRDPSSLGVESLQNILEQGDAAWITRQMIDQGKIFNAFVSLLLHDTWSVRLGAMVIVEELAQEAPALADQLCPHLMKVFHQKDTTVKGDILYALGEAGGPQIIDWIKEQQPQLSHPDLEDAANEALETLADRHG